MALTMRDFARRARRTSKRVVFSYFFDWIVIIAIAAIGAGFNYIEATATRHAFSLSDLRISYPHTPDTVSVAALGLAVLCGPAFITFIICMLFVPGPTITKSTPRALIWRRKLWEWNTAWMGLGLSLASALFITEGLKDAAGRPRPHLLAVCDPDTSPESIARWKVGGLGGNSVDTAVPIVVTWQICRTAGTSALHNAFASWPSGHSSSSWAGFLYLTLFICAKLGVQIPFLPINSADRQSISTFDEDKKSAPPRNHAAAPPVYLLLIAAIPVGAAAYISVSRWFDYRHHPFDIISGSVIGIACAWSSFRLYHLPIRQGSGWAWGARSRERAFWMGVGRHDYVGDEGWEAAAVSGRSRQDVENAAGDGIEMRIPPKSSQSGHEGLAPGSGRSDEARLINSQRSSEETRFE